MAALPLLILTTIGSVFAYERGREWWLARNLPPARADAANVLILVMDTVRADSFDRLRETGQIPNLARLAAEGARFTNAWSTTSWSLPSQASILTGRYPHEHGADWPKIRLSRHSVTLGDHFREKGYIAGVFSGNSAWVVPEYLGAGFQRFEAYQAENLFRRTVYGRKIDKQLEPRGYHSAGRGKTAADIRRQLLRFIDDYPDRPYFAYLCFMDVNRTFHDHRLNRRAPEPVVIRSYERAMRDLDAEIGTLLTALGSRAHSRDTLVVVTSDHGESFGPSVTTDHKPTGHGTSLYREQLQVPLLIHYPGRVPAGRVVNQTTSIVQIPATILHLLRSEDPRMAGEPLVSNPAPATWTGADAGSPGCVLGNLRFPEESREDLSVICGSWRYIVVGANRPKRVSTELYDMAGDPLEQNNLAGREDLRGLQAEMETQLQRLSATGAAASMARQSGLESRSRE